MTDDEQSSLDFSLISKAEGDVGADEAELRSLARFILDVEAATGTWEIVVALVSDDELRVLHGRFMGVDEPTDIMTFPYGDDVAGGDLAISLDHARVRAAEWGNTPGEELQFLVAHGVLHLLGWQDTTADLRHAMLERQAHLIDLWRSQRGT